MLRIYTRVHKQIVSWLLHTLAHALSLASSLLLSRSFWPLSCSLALSLSLLLYTHTPSMGRSKMSSNVWDKSIRFGRLPAWMQDKWARKRRKVGTSAQESKNERKSSPESDSSVLAMMRRYPEMARRLPLWPIHWLVLRSTTIVTGLFVQSNLAICGVYSSYVSHFRFNPYVCTQTKARVFHRECISIIIWRTGPVVLGKDMDSLVLNLCVVFFRCLLVQKYYPGLVYWHHV